MDPAARDIVVVDANNRLAEPPSGLHSTEKQDAGATTPSAHWSEDGTADGSTKRRSLQQQQQQQQQEQEQRRQQHRERTYPYSRYLPYQVEDDQDRQKNLDDILKRLYIAIEARDFVPGAVHWTRELRNWLFLKFDLSREKRATLAKLFYHLSLTPGIEYAVSERFASTFMTLTKRKHYLHPGEDLLLDWRPLFKELKVFVIPQESNLSHTTNVKRSVRTLTKLCAFAQMYFDPRDVPVLLQTLLPYFSTSGPEIAFVVVGLLSLLMPTAPAADAQDPKLVPQYYLPTIFHLWSLLNRAREVDIHMLDLLSRLARDSLPASHIAFSEHGIFTREQSALIFTAILRLLEIPVGQARSPYTSTVEGLVGAGLMLSRDQRKHPISHHIARWIVMSLSPECLDKPDSILAHLEGLIQAVETFFHPSNSGAWTKTLSQLVYYLADFFVMRWNRERSGEMDVPPGRRLNDALKQKFVTCLRDVIFMGIYSKSGTAMNFSLSTLQNLAYLEPGLILPGALQRIYPSMQGLVEVHRTTSSLRSLQALAKVMVQTKGFRCHVTTLLGLALPGVDANDLEKTLHTLSFIQVACYNIPLYNLTEGHPDLNGSALAMQWITSEVDRMEREGSTVKLDYAELSPDDEELILRSSTASFDEFLISFLGKVFTLLENLPDAARVRNGSPEENVVNTLPATLTPLLASLSPQLYDLALGKIADFVANHVIHQARDAMAFICNALCKVHPEKALKRFVPMLVQAIRSEIDENGAASTRNTGTDVLPRDRALVWHVSMLSMCVVHVGDAVLQHQEQLFKIALYMQDKCKGIPTVHVSNFIHHLLLNLTSTYTIDYSLYEPSVVKNGLQPEHWGWSPRPSELSFKWHTPSRPEIEFAVRLFKSQAESALEQLESLISDTPRIKRDGTGKEWSDEVVRLLVLLRLIVSGVCILFDVNALPKSTNTQKSEDSASDDDSDDKDVKPVYHYPTGYPLDPSDPLYTTLHELRQKIGEVFHQVHQFLTDKQEDDVACFNALYTAYRSWFIDVGTERSAHVLDRVTRLLATDIHPFKISGLRKNYPRPLLLRRAHVYHLQRLRHNSSPRPASDLDKLLLFDLAESSVSLYTEIRRTAQSAGESAVKMIIGARTLVVPVLLEALERAVQTNSFPRMKGGIYSLFCGSLAKTVGRNWKFAPSLIRSFIEVSVADKPSLQKLAASVAFQMMQIGEPLDQEVILDQSVIDTIAPSEPVEEAITSRREVVQRKRNTTEARKAEFALELVDLAKASHWKKASRAATIVLHVGFRFETIAPASLVELITAGTIDTHPGLRGLYSGALVGLFTLIELRAVCAHKYENCLLEKQIQPGKIQVPTQRDDPEWPQKFLGMFEKPEADYYIDHDYPGWLVWDETMPAYEANRAARLQYDASESAVRSQIGSLLNRKWFKTFFDYLKQEPRDATVDKFRMSSAMLLVYAFDLMHDGATEVSFADIKEEVEAVYQDGSDKHQHRATAEILGALLISVTEESPDRNKDVWDYVFPFIRRIFSDSLTPENLGYWAMFLHLVLQGRDPRRVWPIYEWLSSFRLDLTSNAAFKESSKIDLLQQCVTDAGWHYQLGKPILTDFLGHLDHPYKGVREAMAHTLASFFRTRNYESYRDVDALVKAQRESSSIGMKPYRPSEEFASIIRTVFDSLEKWRRERSPGQQTPSSYTSGSKTVLLWLDGSLSSYECVQLVSFFPDVFMEQLLHMMDVKEDPELQSLAYHVFRHLPNVPHRPDEGRQFIRALIRIGKTSALWHQRLRILINMQVIYFRQLFLMPVAEQQALFDCVSEMLEDPQLEVRLGASTTLSGMIRCSPIPLRTSIVYSLKPRFSRMLEKHPFPKRPPTGTPTPEHTRIILMRHAAVLGLGALIQAFPYTSPPSPWLPETLAFLAVKASADPGMVGKSVKSILSDFKKTRQDTWHIDVKVFTPEQLADLEGVLWKSYFA